MTTQYRLISSDGHLGATGALARASPQAFA